MCKLFSLTGAAMLPCLKEVLKMVRFEYEGYSAELQMIGDALCLVTPNGRPPFPEVADGMDALLTLEERWKIPQIVVRDGKELSGHELIEYEIPTAGMFTLEQELDWCMFNRRHIVHNAVDGKLWRVDVGWDYADDKRRAERRLLPKYSRYHTQAEWLIPAKPDAFSALLEKTLRKKYPDAEVGYREGLFGTRVGYFVRETRSDYIPTVCITHSAHQMRCLWHERRQAETPVDMLVENERMAFIRKTARELLPKSWGSLFPADADVVMVRVNTFALHTLAGLYAEFPNNIGMEKTPLGYAVAWRNGGGDMLLMRVRPDGTVRCPEEYKGRILGKGGNNIKQLATKQNRGYIKLI
jgi:hypothetical protein